MSTFGSQTSLYSRLVIVYVALGSLVGKQSMDKAIPLRASIEKQDGNKTFDARNSLEVRASWSPIS